MRIGWSLKEACAVLGIHERRVTQSLDPTLERMARLWRADPTRTMAALLDAVAHLDPMTDSELALRQLIQTGRAESQHTHPNRR